MPTTQRPNITRQELNRVLADAVRNIDATMQWLRHGEIEQAKYNLRGLREQLTELARITERG